MINKKRLIETTQQLIRIDSQSPGSNEFKIARFVKNYLEKLGLEVKIYEFKKMRSNLVATLAGRDKRHSLLLSPHLDTVPAGKNWRRGPFSALIEGDKIYGLGATDRKGDVAAAMEAIHSLVEEKVVLGYNLVFAPTADEECGSALGIIPLLRRGILRPSVAVVLDADDFSIVVAQKGLLHIKVKLTGTRAHGAYPWLGKNAIDLGIKILADIKKYKFHRQKDNYLKAPTVNIGTIKGGDKVNVVSDWCEFELDLRFLPGDSAARILADIKKIIRRHTAAFKIEIGGIQRPYKIDRRHPLVGCLTQAMRKLGRKARLCGSEGATVITYFEDKGIPAVATGFGCEGCNHIVDEYAKISNLYRGSLVLEEFLKGYKF